MAEFKLQGADKLLRKLRTLTPKMQDKIGRGSARKAMAIVRADARRRVKQFDDPNTPADIARNVYLQQSRRQSRRVGGVVMRVGVSGGARRPVGPDPNASAQPGGDTRHWRYVELGTEKVRARPFLRPALEQNVQQVTATLISHMSRELDEVAR